MLTWQGWVSAPSTAATLFLSWSGMHLKLPQLRYALLVGDALWLANGWVTDSWIACLCSVVALGLNSWMLVTKRDS